MLSIFPYGHQIYKTWPCKIPIILMRNSHHLCKITQFVAILLILWLFFFWSKFMSMPNRHKLLKKVCLFYSVCVYFYSSCVLTKFNRKKPCRFYNSFQEATKAIDDEAGWKKLRIRAKICPKIHSARKNIRMSYQ